MTPIQEIRAIVDQQAEDEGLWFVAETAAEGYVQMELRRLHALIEVRTTSTVADGQSNKGVIATAEQGEIPGQVIDGEGQSS